MTQDTLTRALHLGPHDTIRAAWCEKPSGPGWSNRVVWVLVEDGDHRPRVECLQPDEQPRDVMILFDVAAASHAAMLGAIRRAR